MNKEELKDTLWSGFKSWEIGGGSEIEMIYVPKKWLFEHIDQLDEPEVLSHEWIDENEEQEEMYGTYVVPVRKLQNLLVPKQEEQSAKTVADVIADFYKSLERLKEVLGTEVKELEE